ncbi:MAG: hypothetical protein M3046_13505 [Actinomycetota bacterium]|nr:hypothetical protein [Actinomycetota bacterium]
MKKSAVCMVLLATIIAGSLVAGLSSGHADATEDAARRLVAFVPKDERYNCRVEDTSPGNVNLLPAVRAEADSVSARLECGPDGAAANVAYFQFTNTDALRRAYMATGGSASGQPVRSVEGNCPSEGTWGFKTGDVGRVACDYGTTDLSGQGISETVYRSWTYERQNILAYAFPTTGNTDAVALRTWWSKHAGPLEKADDVQGLASPSDVPNRSAERSLLSHTPKSVRRSCSLIDRSQPDSREPVVFTDRLWVNAAAKCTPTQPGVTTVTYFAVAPSAIDGYFEQYKPAADTLVSDCPNYGTWSTAKGAKSRGAGEYACYITTDSAGSRSPYFAWSDRVLGIVAVARNDSGDGTDSTSVRDTASALQKYWIGAESGGPRRFKASCCH